MQSFMQNDHPEISVIIVARNEQYFIRDCMLSIRKQFSDSFPWELILVDGMSEDRTKEIAVKYAEEAGIENFRIIENTGITLATGWNKGIKAARGNYVIRPDAHAILYPSYISKAYETIKKMPKVAVVGGTLETLAKGYWGEVIRDALSSKAGVGNSSFRTHAESGYKDTAVYGLYRKEVFEKVGYFNEDLVRHQDNEFHSRILAKGYKIYMNREMKAGYYCRDNVPALLNQMYRIGYYLPDLSGRKSMGGLRLRHLAPAAFFISLIIGFLLANFLNIFLYLSLAASAIYLVFIVLNAFYIGLKNLNWKSLWLVFLIPAIHFTYFLGTLTGFIKKLK